MANIDQYLAEIRSAIYGEEVRGSIINALEAQNTETENNTTTAEQALADAQEAITNAQTAADTANTAAAGADESGENAVKIATEAAENATQAASDAAAEAVEIAQTAADSATSTASDAADEAVRIATEAAETAQSTADAAAENANAAANAANAAAMTQIASYDITYQASSIGTEPPTGEWIHSIPQVAEGNYLWTRVIIYDVAENETTFYSVGKMGSSSGGEGGGNLWYGQCETTGNTTAKTVACDGFNLDTGVEIVVKFQYTNTASNATMNVNSTGAYPIYYDNSNIASGLLRESGTYFFVFDGSHYAVVGELSGSAINELQQDVAQINEDLSALSKFHRITYTTSCTTSDSLETIWDDIYANAGVKDTDSYWVVLSYNGGGATSNWIFRTISGGAVSGIIFSHGDPALGLYQFMKTGSSALVRFWGLGNSDISSIGNGTITNALRTLNTSLSDLQTSVSTNTSDISDLDEKVEQNTADIEENKTNIEQNASDITEINSALSDKADKSALTDGSVTKVGTSTVGSSSKPIYLNSGTPTACSMSSVLSTQYFSVDNISVDSQNYADGTLSCSRSGYTAIGIVGYRVNNASSSGTLNTRVYLNRCYLSDSTTITYQVFNVHSSTTAKVLIGFYVLYVAN